MVLKELPGGELYQDDGGSYANEATARRHEAIHRPVSYTHLTLPTIYSV